MQDEIQSLYAALGTALILGVAGYLIKVVLAIILKRRLSSDLVPSIAESGSSVSNVRFLALVGLGARPAETMGTFRLRATIGLRLAYWGRGVLLAVVHGAMGAPVLGIETVLLMVVLAMALHTSLYEISYDQKTVTLPRWWFGRTTRDWADLVTVSTRGPWFMAFVFSTGPKIRAYKHVVGYAGLLETAQKALREA